MIKIAKKNNVTLFVSLLFLQTSWSAMLQTPIQAAAGVVPPNVMFTLDDSGSMGFECVPDSLCTSGSTYVGTTTPKMTTWKTGTAEYDKETIKITKGRCLDNPPPAKNKPCKNLEPDIEEIQIEKSKFNRQMRSNAINPLYYSPKIQYLPWLKADGTRYLSYVGTAAPDNPEDSGSAITNLAANIDVKTKWCSSKSSCSEAIKKIYIAQYFNKTGADVESVDSYENIKISSDNLYYPKSAERTDCKAVVNKCTYSEELQNFSNWYSYHSSRMKVAIAGTAEAFFSVPENYRVGYGRINKTGETDIDGLTINSTLEKGVRPFVSSDKNKFYTWLFQQKPKDGGTPLRRALDAVGFYYSYTDNKGSWGNTPGTDDSTPQSACRRAFHVLMTDGMWNNASALNTNATKDVDSTSGPTITGPNKQNYTYTASAPYSDNYANTLADVAMYYWKRDLHPGLENGVQASAQNPAFWQHMVNYTISFGVLGLLNPATDLPALTSGSKKWPKPNTNGAPENIDDLWHAAVNSRGKFISASNTEEYSDALKGIIDDVAAVNGVETGIGVSSRVISAATSTRKYEVKFSSEKWNGDITAIDLNASGTKDKVAWSAAGKMPPYASRNIFTYNKDVTNNKGIEFTWANLTNSMRTTLYGDIAGGEDLVKYLRGDRSKEDGVFRLRASVLGDVVNSAPIFVKDQVDNQYWFLTAEEPKKTYWRFQAAKKLREAQLFVGANDGMLHVFNDNKGEETFAFIPDSILGKVKKLADINYSHEYFVDGPLVEADIYDTTNNKWRNIVFGGTGAGAKSLFAINVPVPAYALTAMTPPTALTPEQSAPGAQDILWSISNSTSDFDELGYVIHKPEHGVMKDDQWVMIVGNGYESASGKAQLFIINALTGELIKKIDTGIGSKTKLNGLGGVKLVRNKQMQIVSAYAGDLMGNLWKFDLSSKTPNEWQVAFGTTNGARNPLYKTAVAEPITAAPAYIQHPSGGIMLLFGSGKAHDIGDDGVTAQRALYGVWDKVPVDTASTTESDRIVDQSTIIAQALTSSALTDTTGTFYGLIVTPVDYANNRGWRIPLTIDLGQRLVDEAEMTEEMVFMQTMAPSVASSGCSPATIKRYGFLIDPFMKKIEEAKFDTNGDNLFNSSDKNTASVVDLGDSLAVPVMKGGEMLFVQQGNKTNPAARRGHGVKRYWRQIVTPPKF